MILYLFLDKRDVPASEHSFEAELIFHDINHYMNSSSITIIISYSSAWGGDKRVEL
jgi:hypothetical protein